jgi:hypothetical protein
MVFTCPECPCENAHTGAEGAIVQPSLLLGEARSRKNGLPVVFGTKLLKT